MTPCLHGISQGGTIELFVVTVQQTMPQKTPTGGSVPKDVSEFRNCRSTRPAPVYRFMLFFAALMNRPNSWSFLRFWK